MSVIELTTYIDESGTIPKALNTNHQFFVVSLIHTNDATRLTKRFSRSLMKVIKNYPDLINRLKTNRELKASDMSEEMKAKIYSDLISQYTNDDGRIENLEIGIIIMDTIKIKDRFRQNKARCFNYLLSRYFVTFSKRSCLYDSSAKLNLIIDNQNIVTESLHSLQEYLNVELTLKEDYFASDIVANYYDSKDIPLIQLADYVANTILRYLRGDNAAKNNLDILSPLIMGGDFFQFPLS